MCGIAGIFAYHPDAPNIDRDELLRIRENLRNRGPDGEGEWWSQDRRLALAHRRLSIIDLTSTGAQPMVDEKLGVAIVFNGEIYNYAALRSDLETRGHRFRSTSDTEVLLRLYAEKGHSMLHDLRGMYAFAIWDIVKRGWFLARDPFGIKPLYVADDGKTLRIASQVKALIAGGNLDLTEDPAGHVGFYLWGNVPEPYTLYRSIRALPAGSALWIDSAGYRKATEFGSVREFLTKTSQASPIEPRNSTQTLRETLLDSVRHHLIADVPVGVFLSSGMDSTTLTALAAESGGHLKTLTLGFDEFEGTVNDEVPLAEVVARYYGTAHQTIRIQRSDFVEGIAKLLESMDQPSVDGINSYFVSLAAKRVGLKVAISGLGGDELFCGYPSFTEIPRANLLLSGIGQIPGLGRGFRLVSASILKRWTSPKYAGLLEYGGSFGGAYLLRRSLFMPWELPTVLDDDLVRIGWEQLQTLTNLDATIERLPNDHLKVAALEMTWYMRNQLLRDVDWASMAHSVEVRVPLVDPMVVSQVAAMSASGSISKVDLTGTPAKVLPGAVVRRRKTGFFVPVRPWLNSTHQVDRGLRGWAQHVYRSFQA